MYSPRLGRSFVAALIAAVWSMALTGTAAAEPVKCKAAIIKASATYAQARAKALQKCEDTVVKGKLPQSTVCTTETKADGSIRKAADKLTAAINKACGGADKVCGDDTTGEDSGASIGFPATCPNFEGKGCTTAISTANCTGIAECLLCIDGAAVDQAIGLSYASLVTTNPKLKAEKALNKCQAAIGKAAAGFFAAKSKALSKCWVAVNKKKGNAPCPAPGDGKAATAIGKAVVKFANGIKKACAGKDKIFDGTAANATAANDDFTRVQIGFPATCNDVDPPGTLLGPCGGPVTNLQSISTCLYCVNEFKVDCADAIAASTLATYPGECNPAPTPTATPTPTPTPTPTLTATPTPTATATPCGAPGACGNCTLDPGEFCDGAVRGGACGPDFTCVACNCACPTKVSFTGNASAPESVLDTGWTGISHRAPIISDGTASITLSCPGGGTSRPCGTCTVSGPVANGAGKLDSQRCTNDTSIPCTDNTPCTAGGGTCQFFFGSNLPLAAGGVTVCAVNQFNGSVSGTANVETGEAVTVANLTSRVYTGIAIDNPCARCIPNPVDIINDGVKGGTCDGGTRVGLTCDGNGTVFNRPDFGTTSLDCPLAAGALIATLPIDLSNATGPVTKTLSSSSPNCQAAAGEKCLCDTCNNAAATPCSSNADCTEIGHTVCGGKRCLGGPNNGTSCTVNTQCPNVCSGGSNNGLACTVNNPDCPGVCVGGSTPGAACFTVVPATCSGGTCSASCPASCNRPGAATAPSACLDNTATVGVLDCADSGNGEGTCTVGPVTQNCSIVSGHAQRGCLNDAACGGAVGSCEAPNRLCFLTGGLTGVNGTNTLTAVGMADAPMEDTSNPTLGAVFCVGPTGASAVNSVSGLPGPGRVTIKGAAVGLP